MVDGASGAAVASNSVAGMRLPIVVNRIQEISRIEVKLKRKFLDCYVSLTSNS